MSFERRLCEDIRTFISVRDVCYLRGRFCTGVLAPGNFTVISCSSLYFWKAGLSFSMRAGSLSDVRVLMSLTTSLSSPGGAPSMKDEQMSIVSLMLDCQE